MEVSIIRVCKDFKLCVNYKSIPNRFKMTNNKHTAILKNPYKGLTLPVGVDLSNISLPLINSLIPAGFPSPAEDFSNEPLDLASYLVTNKIATFFARVGGDSMKEAGIFEGDLVVIDKSLEAVSGSIVFAYFDGGYTIKRYIIKDGRHYLVPENKNFSVIEIPFESDFQILGVVTFTIHKTSRNNSSLI